MVAITTLPPAEVLDNLRSRPGGLTAIEVRLRREEFGANRIEQVRRKPVLLRLLQEFVQFFSIILWVAAGLAFIGEWSAPGEGMARIGIALVTVILVSGLFAFWQEYRNERTLAALLKLLPQTVKVLRDQSLLQVAAEELVVGDVIRLAQGDNVPADCRLIQSFGVRVNNAVLTGEPLPKACDANASPESDPLRSRNVILAGASLVGGEGMAAVFAVGSRTEFGRIAQLAQTSGEGSSPLRRQLAHLSRVIGALAIAIGFGFFAIGVLIDVPFWKDFIFAIGIIVAMVPEGLLPTLTLALVLAAQRMAKRNVLIRHLPAVETLGSATVICTDKTGTLTENRMRARDLWLAGNCYPASALAERADLIAAHRDFFFAAAHCHSLQEVVAAGATAWHGDPMEVAMVKMAQEALPPHDALPRLDEISFDTDRMRHSVVCATTEGPALFCKGAVEAVLPLCTRVNAGDALHTLDPALADSVRQAEEAMATEGLRVLAFASRRLGRDTPRDALEQEMVLQGLVGFEDPPRAEVPEAIERCFLAGIKVIMVTGDHPRTAAAIARAIGLVRGGDARVITGNELRVFSPIELQLALDTPELIFARVGADQKMRIVEALVSKRQVVAVTGDGVNDAPALKVAHIGIAMGRSGTDVAKQAADMVLLDDNFASIVGAIEEGRAVFQNIRKFLTYVLVHNVAELVPYLAFALFQIPLPLTPIQALSIDMGTDSLTALGLGAERPDPALMRLPPRRGERLLNLALALRAYVFLGLIEAAGALAAYFVVLFDGGWHFGESLAANDPLYLRATTGCLSAIIVMQIANVYLCRSSVRSIFATGFTDNPLIVAGVGLEIVLLLLIDYSPWGNALLATAPLPLELWAFIVPCAVGMILLEEARKWSARRGLSQPSLEAAPRRGSSP